MNMFINFLIASVVAGAPLLFGTLGEIITERSGNLNLGVEGMMAMGAVGGFYVGYTTDNVLLALLGSFLFGMFGALIYTVLTVTFKANQNVTGLTLTIFGVGFSEFLIEYFRTTAENPVLKLSPEFTAKVGNVHIPFLSDIPYIGKLFFQYNPIIYLGILLCIICGIYLNHTRLGLNTKAVGESPAAADAAGINVTAVKYINCLLGGGICGLGGAYIALVTCGGVLTTNCINGVGWIAVALVIFAGWNPFTCILGSFVFGAFTILRFYIPDSIPRLPDAIYDMLPFLITAVVLVITSIRQKKEKAQPAGCGINYSREER